MQPAIGYGNTLPVASGSEVLPSFLKQLPVIVFSHGMGEKRITIQHHHVSLHAVAWSGTRPGIADAEVHVRPVITLD